MRCERRRRPSRGASLHLPRAGRGAVQARGRGRHDAIVLRRAIPVTRRRRAARRNRRWMGGLAGRKSRARSAPRRPLQRRRRQTPRRRRSGPDSGSFRTSAGPRYARPDRRRGAARGTVTAGPSTGSGSGALGRPSSPASDAVRAREGRARWRTPDGRASPPWTARRSHRSNAWGAIVDARAPPPQALRTAVEDRRDAGLGDLAGLRPGRSGWRPGSRKSCGAPTDADRGVAARCGARRRDGPRR